MVLPYIFQFKSEFGNKEFMIWATVSSQSCFCWLYRASLSLAVKKYSPSDFGIDYLVMSMCRVFSCVVWRGFLLWPVCFLFKTLLAFALLHFVLQGQTCLLLQVSLEFLFGLLVGGKSTLVNMLSWTSQIPWSYLDYSCFSSSSSNCQEIQMIF